jgi:GxxExxY protein
MKINKLTEVVIGSAIEVHRRLEPGLLESAYQECMARELSIRGVPFAREQPLPLNYKGLKLSCRYRLGFLVANKLVLELKAVDSLQPVHVAQ